MIRKISTVLALIIVAALVFVLVGCQNGADGTNGKDGIDGANGKSAYELYKENNPNYSGSEQQWLNDLANGKLVKTKRYDVVTYGNTLYAVVTKGSASSNGSIMTLTDCIAQLNTPIVLPTSDKARWQINLNGTLCTNDSGVQLLTSTANSEVGRVYLAANAAQNKVYLGVNIGGVYFNYCWGVSSSVLKSDHDYVITYEDGEYLLKVDDGNFSQFEVVNYNQTNNVIVSDAEQVCDDFNQKVRAIFGQDFITLTCLGANGFTVNSKLSYVQVETSSIYDYQILSCHPLKGATIYHLGSSISYGHANSGVSFAEQIRDLTGSKMVKQTVSGTTLSNQKDNSYAARWSNFTFDDNPDYLILQLSTNDFAQSGVTIGEVSGKNETENFTPNTTASAIEYIISQTKAKSPETKIIVYSCVVNQSWANSYPQYGEFVNNQLGLLRDKWDVEVIDLYNADMLFKGILADDIHPNAAGYAAMFTPTMINVMTSGVSQKNK